MESLSLALPALGCLVMMPLMAWFMAQGMRNRDRGPDAGQPTPGDEAERERTHELDQLREEVARLRTEVDAGASPRGPANG